MMTEIHITKEDITAGISQRCNRCPIALAIQRRFPHVRAHVDYTEITVFVWEDPARWRSDMTTRSPVRVHGRTIYTQETPEEASCFMAIFDDAKMLVSPMSFMLKTPWCNE